MTFTFPVEKDDFTAENGVTYSWTGSHWRVKSYKVDDNKVDELREEFDEKLEGYLPLAGGDMEGDISAGGHVVTDLGNPEYAGHATPRRYVDEADQELQGEIDNLKQEIEHLAPSFERGEWDLTTEWPSPGKYGVYKTITYEAAVAALQEQLVECNRNCGGDPVCQSSCTRMYEAAMGEIEQYNPEEGGSGFIYEPETDWEQVNRVVFAEKDALGISHSFDDVVPGQFMDLYNKDDEGYFIAQVESVSRDPDDDDIIIVAVDAAQWSELPPSGRALVKFFTIDDGVDVADFVKKSGDKMTGVLNMQDNYIAGVKDPSSGTDAANRRYVTSNFIGNAGTQNLPGSKWNIRTRKEDNSGSYNMIDIKDDEMHLYHVADAKEDLHAANWKQIKDYAVNKSGDTVKGKIEFNAPRKEAATNSFVIRGALNVNGEFKEGQVIFKDYRDGTASSHDSSIMYFGRIDGPNHIINKQYLEQYVADNAGEKSDKVIIESGSSVPTLETGRMYLNTTTKMIHVGT